MESEFEDLRLYQRYSNCLLYNSKQIRKQTSEIVLPSVEMGIISPDITTSQIIRVSIAKVWRQSKYPLMNEQVKKMCHICVYVYVFVLCVCLYTQWNVIHLLKNLAICDLNGPWGHYAKWNKPDKEIDRYCVISLMCEI